MTRPTRHRSDAHPCPGVTAHPLRSRSWFGRLLLAGWAAVAMPLSAAAQAPAPASGQVENDPIRCWSRSSSGAVRIGETFRVTLTCAVIETDLVQVIPDESRLGVNVIQMTPFEVTGGNHPADIKTTTRRFFQYDYDIRMINPDAIGTDVPIPLLQVSYRVNSRIAGNQQTQGREMVYVLPELWVKVLSIVPQSTTDIRDTEAASFDRIERINFRAGALEIVGTTLVVLGGVMTVVALIGIARRAGQQARGLQERALSRAAVMRLAVRELQASARDGGSWSDPAVLNRALTAVRIIAAGAIDRPITQQVVAPDAASGEGRFVVSRLRRGKAIAVSAAATSADVARVLARLAPGDSRRAVLEPLQEALEKLAAAQYSRPGADRSGIDAALTAALDSARTVRAQHTWPRTWLHRFTSLGTARLRRA